MERDKVISHFMGLGYEPIVNENTGVVHFCELLPRMEILINKHSIGLHFPTVTILNSCLTKHANFNEVMDWVNKQYEYYK